MKRKIDSAKKAGIAVLAVSVASVIFSCHDLTKLNENPNGLRDPEIRQLLVSVLYSTAVSYHEDAYASRTGTMMQYFVVDAWGGVSRMDFTTEEFDKFLSKKLRNARELERLADEQELDAYKGVSKVMQAFVWGYMTDCFGDIPFSESLSKDIFTPKYDAQRDVYESILEMLEEANDILAQANTNEVSIEYDIVYSGDVKKWQKFANSLQLRYYMRLSLKLPDFAKEGVEKIMGDKVKYPVFETNADGAKVEYVGNNFTDSFLGGTIKDTDGSSDYRRRKACKTFVDKLIELNDPRLHVIWDPVETRIAASSTDDTDEIIDDVRYVGQNLLDEYAVDKQNQDKLYSEERYVGIAPHPAGSLNAYNYNFNLEKDKDGVYMPATVQDSHYNPHVSQLNHGIFRQNAHVLNPAYMMQYSEVCFLLAEAALEGWSVGGTPESYYNSGVEAGLDRFSEAGGYGAYIAQPEVAWNGTKERLAEQRWLSMFMMPESWFVWRKTGLPDMLSRVKQDSDYAGAVIRVTAIRYQYDPEEPTLNMVEYNKAVNNADNLESTEYTTTPSPDHITSKMWVLQDTGNPW